MHTLETRQKISASKKGKPRPDMIGNKFGKGYKYWLGKNRSEETKSKISKSKKGCPPTITSFQKGHPAPKTAFQKGNPSPKTAYKKGQSYTSLHKGELHPNWKGGATPKNKKIRNSIEFRLWRETVFARDNWTCQKCETKGGKLHPHHILNFAQYSELRFAIDNGITFCEKCHKEFHKIYGKENNTKEQINEYFGRT